MLEDGDIDCSGLARHMGVDEGDLLWLDSKGFVTL